MLLEPMRQLHLAQHRQHLGDRSPDQGFGGPTKDTHAGLVAPLHHALRIGHHDGIGCRVHHHLVARLRALQGGVHVARHVACATPCGDQHHIHMQAAQGEQQPRQAGHGHPCPGRPDFSQRLRVIPSGNAQRQGLPQQHDLQFGDVLATTGLPLGAPRRQRAKVALETPGAWRGLEWPHGLVAQARDQPLVIGAHDGGGQGAHQA